ncbi:MAG: tRNA epoxyqueuosine(34) reductase QueG, partial [Thermoanaerobaculia bacterium]
MRESSVDPGERSRQLTAWALEVGFDRAGVAAVGRAATGDAYLAWLARGDQAGLTYLARRVEARLDPRRLLPGARSALCVALQYGSPEESGPPGTLGRAVARYARGRDYHNFMGRRLRRLAERIRRAFPGAAARAYVDTGPVLERELAAAAGLGAVGKNTMLLHPEGGSYFLLGEVLTTLDLEPDQPVADLCGTCTRCLDACPTGALAAPYRLDSRRCISYWTIEHRGPIDEPMRSQLGGWVFGCDICQEACPWNAGPAAPERPEFAPAAERRDLDLAGLLRLSEAAYRTRFRGSPLQRAGRAGLQRNAAVALANPEVEGAAVLIEVLQAGEPLTRSHAAWA